MISTLRPLIDGLIQAMESGDVPEFNRSMRLVREATVGLDSGALTDVVECLAPTLGNQIGIFAKAAVLAGALVEFGASPLPLYDVMPRRAMAALNYCDVFRTAWAAAGGDRPRPDPRDKSQIAATVRTLVDHARRHGISEQDATCAALSWFDVEDWLLPMLTLLARQEFRAAMTHRDEVRSAASTMADDFGTAAWLYGLTLVLDDEPLVALHPETGSGFRLTMSGVGDNAQLHTLLADRVIGAPARGLLGGRRPEPAWVAAATDGAPGPFGWEDCPRRLFRLFDGQGTYIPPDGRPSDIALVDETRVIVLHPPLGEMGFQNARVYKHMMPTMTLDRVMDPAEAAAWLSRISPAVETDLFSVNKRDRPAAE